MEPELREAYLTDLVLSTIKRAESLKEKKKKKINFII